MIKPALAVFAAIFSFISLGVILAQPESEKTANADKSYAFTAGFSGGTYFAIAKSLKKVAPFKIEVQDSRGSVENINRIKNNEAQIGMAQVDILTNLYLFDRDIKRRVKVLIPLYPEEVHIVSRKSVKRIKDLAGKKISIGPVGSGTNKTSRIVLGTLGISGNVSTYQELSTTEALAALLQGEIDAFTLVAGAPVSLLKKLPKKNKKKMRLINIKGQPAKMLTGKNFSYDKAKIKKKTYKWYKKKIKTISTRSLIIVRDDFPEELAAALLKKMFKKKKKLVKAHKKWKKLSLKYARKYLSETDSYFFHKAAAKYIRK